MKAENKTTREPAIEWWENTIKNAKLRVDWKVCLCIKYFNIYTDYTKLTDNQIEKIYLSEMNEKDDKDIAELENTLFDELTGAPTSKQEDEAV